MKLINGIGVLLIIAFNSCEKNKGTPLLLTAGCNVTNITYKNTLQPIINLNCAYSLSCHAAGTVYADFSTYDGLKTYVDNGQLYEQMFISHKMPPSPQPLLDICELTQIKVWIDNGAPQ